MLSYKLVLYCHYIVTLWFWTIHSNWSQYNRAWEKKCNQSFRTIIEKVTCDKQKATYVLVSRDVPTHFLDFQVVINL